MLLGTLGAILLGNLFTGKSILHDMMKYNLISENKDKKQETMKLSSI